MARCIAICITFPEKCCPCHNIDNDKLLGFQFDITLIPLQGDSICRYARRLVDDVGEVLVLHSCGKSSTIVKPITTRNLNLYITYKH